MKENWTKQLKEINYIKDERNGKQITNTNAGTIQFNSYSAFVMFSMIR